MDHSESLNTRMKSTSGKKLTLALVLLVIIGYEARATVDAVEFSLAPTKAPVTGPVSAIDRQHIWVGLTYTGDGGISWTERCPPTDLADKFLDTPPYGQTTYFVTAAIGWLTGIDAVWATTDTGRTWEPKFRGHFHAITFAGEHGWMAVGDDRAVANYVSPDLGRTWTRCGSSWSLLEVAPLESASFIDAKHGWITIAQYDRLARPLAVGVARTTDGGCAWETLWWDSDRRGNSLAGIQFIDQTFGWLFADHGRLLQTEDGGKTWHRVVLPKPRFNLESAYLVDKKTGWILGSPAAGSTLYYTSDAGETWISVPDLDIRDNRGAAHTIPPLWGDMFLARTRFIR